MPNRKTSFLVLLMLLGSVIAFATPAVEELNSYFLPEGPMEVISPNGKQVAFLRLSEKKYSFWLNGENPRTEMVRWPQLWIKDGDGKNEKMLVDVGGIAYDLTSPDLAYDATGMVFSLDGKWIYFSRRLSITDHPGDSGLYRVLADGSSVEQQIGYASSFHVVERGKYKGFFLIEHSIMGASPKMQALLAEKRNRPMKSLSKEEIEEVAAAIAEGEEGRREEYWLVSPEGEHVKKLRETPTMEGMTSAEYAALKREVEGMK